MSKNQLGSFGLGAKSLLATGVDFYTVTSCYNGREYSFNVFKDHVVPNISKFNDDGSINEMEVFKPGEEDEYTVYYKNTTSLNKVTIETEVKRHRKMDFINSIENQLGFIPNIELLMADGLDNLSPPVKRTISTKILFSTDNIVVGEADYYAVPQILLRPGKDSNIKISYGTINFEELEMKKYSGNVGFVLDIGEVDVTPSRENVIWNTKTREAIKNMFIKAQETVQDLIEEKIKDEKNLPDYITLLNTFKSKNTMTGLSELYKIVDISSISNTFRGFKMSDAAYILERNDALKKGLIFSSTPVKSDYNGGISVDDTNYRGNLSNDFVSLLSRKNSNSKLVVYIGEVKSTGLARYIADKYNIGKHDNHTQVNVIYFSEELYTLYLEEVKKAGGIDAYIDSAYKKSSFGRVLVGEVIRFTLDPVSKLRTLHHKDVDFVKMSELGKAQETKQNSKYLTHAERQKQAGKVIGNLHHTSSGTYREYYDEFNLNDVYIYVMGDRVVGKILSACYANIPSGMKIIAFSYENFKRFYKLPGVKLLSDAFYTIEFGDLRFTKLGTELLPSSIKGEISHLYDKNTPDTDVVAGVYPFLKGKFRSFVVNKSTFQEYQRESVRKMRERYPKYISLPVQE